MNRALRPVGSPIPLRASANEAEPDLTCGGRYSVRFLDSGTAALAQALFFARHRAGGKPALLPAYGCPDLVAAAVFAGVESRMVDLEAESPFLSHSALRAHADQSCAIVAVNFLGMPERLDALRALAHDAKTLLVEDSAQMAPFAGGTMPTGDLVVYSFGRGKPVSLLGGGALLIRRELAEEFDFVLPAPSPAAASTLFFRMKSVIYNVAIQPQVYSLLRNIPALRLGRVEYRPLEKITGMPMSARSLLGAAFRRSACISAPQKLLAGALAAVPDALVDLPVALGHATAPLLRYPLLVNAGARNELAAELSRAGLGASVLYGKALADLDGLPPTTGEPPENAREFAARLITLPVHADVKPKDIERMLAILLAQ